MVLCNPKLILKIGNVHVFRKLSVENLKSLKYLKKISMVQSYFQIFNLSGCIFPKKKLFTETSPDDVEKKRLKALYLFHSRLN